MAIKSFDRYFYNLPEFTKEEDFEKFWEKSIAEIKKIPIDPELHESHKKSTAKFKAYDISYNGFLKTRLSGVLYVPKKNEKSKTIIHIHDYNRYPEKGLVRHLNDEVAHLVLILRGHSILEHRPEEEQQHGLGFIVENIIDRETYYLRSVYLDTLRSIDFLRLLNFLDCTAIGIYGKGLGAAAGFFAAAFSDRIKAVVLDSPTFCNLPLSQNISESDAAKEINDIINVQKSKKHQIKKNLTYFDIINFVPLFNTPVLFISGLMDETAPAECVLGFFNLIQSEKTIEVYPEEGNSPGGEAQRIRAINWLISEINK